MLPKKLLGKKTEEVLVQAMAMRASAMKIAPRKAGEFDLIWREERLRSGIQRGLESYQNQNNSFWCRYAHCGQTARKSTLHARDERRKKDGLSRFMQHVKEMHPIIWNREYKTYEKYMNKGGDK